MTRLSTSIALGRTAVAPYIGSIFKTLEMGEVDFSQGCALGMGLIGSGEEITERFGLTKSIYVAWPWLNMQMPTPCGCTDTFRSNAFGVIGHIFDEHVMGDKDWTLDQLIDWVRSVEPPEPDELSTQPSTPAQRQVAGVLG